MDHDAKILLPGGAGLVGQNLIVLLKQRGYHNLVVIDKHRQNTAILRQLQPDIEVIEADLADPGDWQASFAGAQMLVMLQAHIGDTAAEPFYRNNILSTQRVLAAMRQHQVPYCIHISSSVIESVANDDYTNTKKEQERLVVESGLAHCVLRPTLMFGWFDRKHLGWLSRFMRKSPLFPIPGDGKYTRQPLYVMDFCRIIVSCMERHPDKAIYNITGREHIDYVDMIRAIRDTVGSKTWIIHIPYRLFWWLLKIYALFDRHPPFTVDQLDALLGRDEFELIPWWEVFQIEPPTPFTVAIQETFLDPTYSRHVLHF
jgi:nucleoside-diphosphate-sugar epimerase